MFSVCRVLLLALLLVCPVAAQQDWRQATPNYRWSFPQDHWTHPRYRTEWWYFTGQLQSVDDPRQTFAYQFTVFRVGLTADTPPINSNPWRVPSMFMGHATLMDGLTGERVFSEVLYRTTPQLAGFGQSPDSVIAWSLGAPGTAGEWRLIWNGDGFDFIMTDDTEQMAMEIKTRPTKPITLQGPNGYSRKGASQTAASLYYSFTRLETSGTVSLNGRTWQVTGESWMDKEFGSNQLDEEQIGWDWFSLQLDDGRDLMLYRLRDIRGNTTQSQGTLIPPQGQPQPVDNWNGTSQGNWRSEATGTIYPVRWYIHIPDQTLDLTIVPTHGEQENVSKLVPDLFYWEGAVDVFDAAGDHIGRGFVELVGYGRSRRPAI